jgi:hypothetical protein
LRIKKALPCLTLEAEIAAARRLMKLAPFKSHLLLVPVLVAVTVIVGIAGLVVVFVLMS